MDNDLLYSCADCGAHVREDDGGCRDCEVCAGCPGECHEAAPAIWRAATTFSTACARTGSNDDAGGSGHAGRNDIRNSGRDIRGGNW